MSSTETKPEGYSSWAAGWTGFAGIMLILMGVLDMVQGLVAIIEDEFYVVGAEWVFEFDVTAWGWIHLLLGAALILSGFGVFTGNVVARTVGVIVAGLGVIWNFAWLPYYPVWSIVLIAVGIAVIWALTVHGRDITHV